MSDSSTMNLSDLDKAILIITKNNSKWYTGHIKRNTFDHNKVKYKIINDMTIFQFLSKTAEKLEKQYMILDIH